MLVSDWSFTVSKTNLDGAGFSIGKGSHLSASALACTVVLQNFNVYSQPDKNKDHLRIRAEAWGEVERCSISNARRGLWFVTSSKWCPIKYECNFLMPNMYAKPFSSWEKSFCTHYRLDRSLCAIRHFVSTAPSLELLYYIPYHEIFDPCQLTKELAKAAGKILPPRVWFSHWLCLRNVQAVSCFTRKHICWDLVCTRCNCWRVKIQHGATPVLVLDVVDLVAKSNPAAFVVLIDRAKFLTNEGSLFVNSEGSVMPLVNKIVKFACEEMWDH